MFRKVSYPFLPSLSTFYIFFSEDSLMWFSSVHGLTSFDGTEAIYHNTPQQASDLGLNKIACIAEDKAHNLYISTRYKLLYYNRKERSFSELDSLLPPVNKKTISMMVMKVDESGIVYMGSLAYGLLIYDPARRSVEHLNLDTNKKGAWENRNFNTIACFADHFSDRTKMWVGTYNGIYLFDKNKKALSKNFVITTPLFDALGKEKAYYDVHKMDVTDDSTIWFNIWAGGFCRYNSNTGNVKIFCQADIALKGKPVPLYVIPSFVKISSGKYLLGIEGKKSAIFDTNTGSIEFINISTDNELKEGVRFCTEDKQGNIWIIRKGLLYVSLPEYSRLRHVSITTKLVFRNIPLNTETRGVFFDSTERLYYLSVRFCDAVYVFDSGFNFVRTIPGIGCPNPNYRVCGTDKITKDGSNRIWTSGWRTYVKLPTATRFDSIASVFPQLKWVTTKGEFNDLRTTRNGDVVLAKSDVAYLIDHRTLKVDTIKCPSINNPNKFRFTASPLGYDPDNDFLYLLNGDGIGQFSLRNRSWRILDHKEIFGELVPYLQILKYAIDATGQIWLLLDQQKIRILNPKTLKCTDSITVGQRGLLFGQYSDLINGGPDYMFLLGLYGAVAYNFKSEKSLLFDNYNGLTDPAPYSLLSANGHLILGQGNQIEYFNSRDFVRNELSLSSRLNVKVTGKKGERDLIAETNKVIKLRHHENNITLSFSALDFLYPERVQYAYILTGINNEWNYSGYFNRKISYNNLEPGDYKFKVKAQQLGGNWKENENVFTISILPPFWGTKWFRALSVLLAVGMLFLGFRLRLQYIRKEERKKAFQQRELLELEAKALRAQMNPHFIFNCMNSIKALIQNDEKQKSIHYLTTFSKLIRTLFNNSDKRQISLYDELETCKLYTQLEAMRLDGKLNYKFDIDESLDLKSVMVPALIVQPFIENAIWHGIVPKDKGVVSVKVFGNDEVITCEVEDDGIGREMSKKNKSITPVIHNSKGINLSQARLDLENLLGDKSAVVSILDKNGANGASGTKVLIEFNIR
ncbi:MAG TPA: histidine kinase [Chitinophagaceae bacterium]